jgi:hypothetical protein
MMMIDVASGGFLAVEIRDAAAMQPRLHLTSLARPCQPAPPTFISSIKITGSLFPRGSHDTPMNCHSPSFVDFLMLFDSQLRVPGPDQRGFPVTQVQLVHQNNANTSSTPTPEALDSCNNSPRPLHLHAPAVLAAFAAARLSVTFGLGLPLTEHADAQHSCVSEDALSLS